MISKKEKLIEMIEAGRSVFCIWINETRVIKSYNKEKDTFFVSCHHLKFEELELDTPSEIKEYLKNAKILEEFDE